jgi:hypothetical protein
MLVSFLAAAAAASQVFFMDLSDDIMMSDNIFLARVESSFETPMDYARRVDYTLSVLSVVSCTDSLSDSMAAIYSMLLPRSWVDQSGNEVWESPLVNGSGLEFMVSPGDTVLVFGSALPSGDSSVPMGIFRIESVDSLASVMKMLEEMDR